MIDWFRTKRGSSIYFEDAGRGRPLLAIHGLGGGAYFFRGLAGRLSDSCRAISVDLPGTGRSLSAGPFSIESWVADLADLIDRRIGEPAIVLGHSMGTIVGLELWRAAPSSVAALILTNGVPRVLPAIHERLADRASRVAVEGLSGWGPRVSPGIFSSDTIRRAPETVALFERLFETQDAATYVRWTRLLLAASADPIVPLVDCPCVAITGRDDQYAPPDAVAAFVGRLPAPAELHVLPACGHMPFFEAPKAFGSAIRAFVKNV